MKLLELSLKHVINETGLDLHLPTSDLIELLSQIVMNGFDESMLSKNIISRYITKL